MNAECAKRVTRPWYLNNPQYYQPSHRQMPAPMDFAQLLEVQLPPLERYMHFYREVLDPQHYLHPSRWGATTVARVPGDNPCFVLMFGPDDTPLAKFYTLEHTVRGQALALENWRLFGGDLRKGNYHGYLTRFVRWEHTAVATAQTKPFTVQAHWAKPDVPKRIVRLREWLGRDTLKLVLPRDIVLPTYDYSHEFQGAPTVLVPQQKAEALGGFLFGGDVELNLGLCAYWDSINAHNRAALTNRDFALYKLFKKLPRQITRTLEYNADAPTYH
ncbi:MAG: hypothetical protein ACRCYP_02415 [Alphaproteobacteria bacterium]